MTAPNQSTQTEGPPPGPPPAEPEDQNGQQQQQQGQQQDPAEEAGASVPPILRGVPLHKFEGAAAEALEKERVVVQLAGAIAGLSWGQRMNVVTRRAVAAYCYRYGVDPLTEIDVLGGNIYVNADFYMRLLAELRQAGYITNHRLVHCHADERHQVTMKDPKAPEWAREQATREWYESLFLRVKFNIPEAAEAACIAMIWLKGGGDPVCAAKWGGGNTSVVQPKRGGGAEPNPVVENNPALSVESQAVRRAMRQGVGSHLPGLMNRLDAMDAEFRVVSHEVRADYEAQESSRAPAIPPAVQRPDGDLDAAQMDAVQMPKALNAAPIPDPYLAQVAEARKRDREALERIPNHEADPKLKVLQTPWEVSHGIDGITRVTRPLEPGDVIHHGQEDITRLVAEADMPEDAGTRSDPGDLRSPEDLAGTLGANATVDPDQAPLPLEGPADGR